MVYSLRLSKWQQRRPINIKNKKFCHAHAYYIIPTRQTYSRGGVPRRFGGTLDHASAPGIGAKSCGRDHLQAILMFAFYLFIFYIYSTYPFSRSPV